MAEAPPNPWDRPRPKKHPIKSATTADELYLAIGKAISTWAMVEHSLCDMFTLMFTGKSGYAAYKMFGAYKSTSGRLAAC